MSPEDEKRLAEIRAEHANDEVKGWCACGFEDDAQQIRLTCDTHFILARLDEEVRARKEAERQLEESLDNHHRAQLSIAVETWRARAGQEKERAQRAEAALKEAEAMRASAESAMRNAGEQWQRAEAALAEWKERAEGQQPYIEGIAARLREAVQSAESKSGLSVGTYCIEHHLCMPCPSCEARAKRNTRKSK